MNTLKNKEMNKHCWHCSENMQLRHLTIHDFATVLKWSEDRPFCLANGWGSYTSSDELYNWWLRCIHNEDENFVRLGIVYDDTLIGYADLASIQGEAAELGIAIGDSRLWGKGLGCRAAMCIIQYASKQLKIIHFYAETDRSNIRSQKMLKKIGFEEISRSDQEQADHLKQSLIQYELHL